MVGPIAARTLRPGARGLVRAVFERSFYACLGTELICVGSESLGAGPLNLLCAPWHYGLAMHPILRVGDAVGVVNGVLNAGDYVYEPSGVLHDETTALEDTTYLFICNGAVLFFDENGFTRYTNWEVMERLRAQAAAEAAPRAEAAE